MSRKSGSRFFDKDMRSIGANSLMLHYPPWFGAEVALASLERFARDVMPRFAASGLALAGE
jgi:hypothetical protein